MDRMQNSSRPLQAEDQALKVKLSTMPASDANSRAVGAAWAAAAGAA